MDYVEIHTYSKYNLIINKYRRKTIYKFYSHGPC